jgi:hypothetical protein
MSTVKLNKWPLLPRVGLLPPLPQEGGWLGLWKKCHQRLQQLLKPRPPCRKEKQPGQCLWLGQQQRCLHQRITWCKMHEREKKGRKNWERWRDVKVFPLLVGQFLPICTTQNLLFRMVIKQTKWWRNKVYQNGKNHTKTCKKYAKNLFRSLPVQ